MISQMSSANTTSNGMATQQCDAHGALNRAGAKWLAFRSCPVITAVQHNSLEAMRHSIDIPPDIKLKVSEYFSDGQSREAVMAIITEFHNRTRGLNVGPSQFCRAILVLADGDVTEFDRLAQVRDDPRDILMAGNAKIGNSRHFFIPPFDDPAYQPLANPDDHEERITND